MRAVSAFLLLCTGDAAASSADLFGLGAEAAALAGAATARSGDFAAAYYNPAGLVRAVHPQASLGIIGFASHLTLDGVALANLQMTDPLGFTVGAAAPLPMGPLARQVFVGLALFTLPDTLVRIIARSPGEPFFPYYDNRSQRLIVLPALAVRLGAGLSAGIALNYLAGLDGQVRASTGATRAIEPRVDEQIFGIARLHFGLAWRSSEDGRDRLAVGLAYRQAFSVPFRSTAAGLVAGEPLSIRVDAEGLYSPHQLALGIAARPAAWLWLSTDIVAAFWSAWRGPFATVESTLPIVGTIASAPPELHYRDTLALRIGAEATVPLHKSLALRVRAGYGAEPSPIPARQPETRLLDGGKHLASAGLGLSIAEHVRIDGSVALQLLEARRLGASESGGFVWSAMANVTVQR